MQIFYDKEELEILVACTDITLIQLHEKEEYCFDAAMYLKRDIERITELRDRLLELNSVKSGNFVIFTRYEIYLLIEIICDVLNTYKEEEYPQDTISRIVSARAPIFEYIINKKTHSLILGRKESRKVK